MDDYQDTSLWPPEDQGFSRSLIQRIAKRLSCSSELSEADEDDLEQVLTLELWKQARSFDRARGTWQGFATMVVMHAESNYLRHRRAQKRDDRPTVSLNTIVETPSGEKVELAQTIPECQRARHRGQDCLDPQAHTDLTLDIAEVTASLPGEWQKLLWLSRTHSNTDVAKRLRRKRTTLIGIRRRVYRQLRKSGLGKYSEN